MAESRKIGDAQWMINEARAVAGLGGCPAAIVSVLTRCADCLEAHIEALDALKMIEAKLPGAETHERMWSDSRVEITLTGAEMAAIEVAIAKAEG